MVYGPHYEHPSSHASGPVMYLIDEGDDFQDEEEDQVSNPDYTESNFLQ